MSLRPLHLYINLIIFTLILHPIVGNSGRQAYQPKHFSIYQNQDETTETSYPILNNSGYITYMFSGREFSNDPNLFDTIQRDETFLNIPKSIQLGPPRLELSYLLELKGQLDEDLFVSYYLFKEPDFPGKYSIEIRKNTNTLRFGQQSLEYKPRPFLQTNRSFEGVQFTTFQQDWNGVLAVGKSKSKPQKFEAYANQTTTFFIGNSFILKGSESVFINNREIPKKDYIFDYIEGKLSFKQLLKPSDVIKVIYQFTNPVEDFLPSLSNKSLAGYQVEWDRKKSINQTDFILLSHQEELSLRNNKDFWKTSSISLNPNHYKPRNISVKYGKKLLVEGVDFTINETNQLDFFYPEFNLNDSLSISYDYVDSEFITDHIPITSPQGPYYLLYGNIIPDSISITLDGYEAREFIDYIIDENSGYLFFSYPIPKNSNVIANYRYLKEYITSVETPSSKISFRSSYLEERSKNSNENISITTDTITAQNITTVDGQKKVQLSRNGLNTDTALQFSDPSLAANLVRIDEYKGELYFEASTDFPNTFTISYEHFKFFTGYYSFYGSGNARYDSRQPLYTPPSLPIAFNGIYKIIISENGQDRYILNSENLGREFLVNYEENGQYFTLDFLIGQYSTLSQLPQANQVITIYYYYDSSQLSPSFDESHHVIDVGTTVRPTDLWSINLDMSQSAINSQTNQRLVTDSFVSDERSAPYTLNTNGLIILQGSEKVFVNGIARQPYTHYTIDYTNGTISFVEPIPSGTPLTVQVKVIDDQLPIKQTAEAYSIVSNIESSTPKQWSLTNRFYTISPDFVPLGELQSDPGETFINTLFNWTSSPRKHFKFDHQSRLFQNDSDAPQTHSHTIQSQLAIPIASLDTKHKVILEKNKLSPTQLTQANLNSLTTFNKDSLLATNSNLLDYSPSIYFGPTHRQFKIGGTLSRQNLQNISDQHSEIDYRELHGQVSYTILNPILIQQLTIKPRLSLSTETSDIYSLYTAKKTKRSFGIDTDSTLYHGLSNTSSLFRDQLLFTRQNTFINDVIYNYSSFTKYAPRYWLNTHYKLSHQEDFGPIIGQEYLVNDEKQFMISKLNPYPIISKLTHSNFFSPYLNKTYLTSTFTDTLRRENNAQTLSLGYFKSLSIYHINLSPNFELSNISVSRNKRSILDENKTTYQRLYRSNYLQRQWTLRTTYDIPYKYFNAFTHQYNTRQSFINTDSFTENISTTTSIFSKINEREFKHQLNMKPKTIHILSMPFYRTQGFVKWHKQEQINLNQTIQTTQTDFLNDFTLKELQVSLNHSMFNRLDQHSKITLNKDYFNRNRTSENIGSLFKDQDTFFHSFEVSPTAKSDIKLEFELNKLNQFSSDEVNQTPNQLLSNSTTLNYRKKSIDLDYSYLLFSKLSSQLGTQYTIITQKQTTNELTDRFNSIVYSPGLKWMPLLGLSITYSHHYHQINSNDDQFKGDSSTISLLYNPIHYDNMNVFIQLSQESHRGFGFNSIENTLSQQQSGTFLRQSIRERHDKIFKASLQISVDILLPNYRYLDRLTISGEGYFKNIKDQVIEQNNFDISGFYLKASILL